MTQDYKECIHAKIVELAAGLGHDARKLQFDEEIPATGFLDSAAIMGLILWLEDEFNFIIPQEDLSLRNLGTIDAIAAYVERRAGAA